MLLYKSPAEKLSSSPEEVKQWLSGQLNKTSRNSKLCPHHTCKLAGNRFLTSVTWTKHKRNLAIQSFQAYILYAGDTKKEREWIVLYSSTNRG